MYQRDHLAKHRRDTARAERQAELEAELEEREAEEKRILEAEGGPGLTATGSIRRKAAKRYEDKAQKNWFWRDVVIIIIITFIIIIFIIINIIIFVFHHHHHYYYCYYQ